MEEFNLSFELNLIPPPNSPQLSEYYQQSTHAKSKFWGIHSEQAFVTDPCSRDNDGFEEYKESLQRQIIACENQLQGGWASIRKPKKPLKVFLRFHLEQFAVTRNRNRKWAPVQITRDINQRWSRMSEGLKQNYHANYDLDFKKYERLISQFTRLTYKPKRPPTPYLLFFSQSLPSFKKDHPDLNQNEIAKLIGRQWLVQTSDQKKPIEEESKRLKAVYAQDIEDWRNEQIENQKGFKEYVQNLQEYEMEYRDLIQKLQQKQTKSYTNSLASSKTSPIAGVDSDFNQLSADSIISDRMQNHYTRSKKIGKYEEGEEETQLSNQSSSVVSNKKSVKNNFKRAEKSSSVSVTKVSQKNSRLSKSAEASSFEIQVDQKEVGSFNRSPMRLRSSPRNESKSGSVSSNDQVILSKKSSIGRKPKHLSKGKESAKNSSVKNKLGSVAKAHAKRREEKKEEKIKKKDAKQGRDKKGVQSKGKQEREVQKVKKVISKQEKVGGMKRDPASEIIKYILGMRNGLETEYLVLFEDGKQRWTIEENPIFNIYSNSMKLEIFQRHLSEYRRKAF